MIVRASFLNLEFDLFTPDQVVAWLEARNGASDFAYLVTPNVDHLVRLADASEEVREAYKRANLILCDSRILALLGRLCGVPLRAVPGSDLVATLFQHVLRDGDNICLIGGAPDHAGRLQVLFPGTRILHYDAPLGLCADSAARTACVAFAVEARARFTLLAVGSPQQELIARELAATPGARGTALCIGASVDFLVGAQRRAPRAIQRMGLEWAWRLMQDPRRLARRYLVEGPKIFPIVMRWHRHRLQND